jgi:hypothetical protein
VGFRDAKRKVIELIQAQRWIAESRPDQLSKNLLWAGQVSEAQAISIIKATGGHQATASPHHAKPEYAVWEFHPTHQQCQWYVKFISLRGRMVNSVSSFRCSGRRMP